MPLARLRPTSLVVAALLVSSAACGGGADVERAPLPEGISVHIDQSRTERKGREVFLRVHNGARRPLTVERFVLTSPRFATVRWTGTEEIGSTYETDLEFAMPRGRCGGALDARVALTYRIGSGERRESSVRVGDPYGNAAYFVDRDCAQLTLEKAATVTVGDPVVSNQDGRPVLRTPITLAPTGRVTGVRLTGFRSTPLFRQAGRTTLDVALGPGDPPTTVEMSVVPARCDPHALAEDKVGTLFGIGVDGPGLSENASYFLPLTRAQRTAFFTFFRSSCGMS
ncbi:hypothetical protein [Aeromicrobium yanjiei]|uniref:Uncharacterized protein n=1 Tax=Aeromicrobium yanjiei TaxID=2662028 RepID=A0A5Q2MM61_9ACTN|nr:hypothetical protein [Aeromicrobium yanjiei]QGG41485.1 hypothetical protein GEV26_08985 [Aeromicrobium yanjiei]